MGCGDQGQMQAVALHKGMEQNKNILWIPLQHLSYKVQTKWQSSQDSWYTTLSTTIMSCSTWCAIQSTHLFPLKAPLPPSCFSHIGKALVQITEFQGGLWHVRFARNYFLKTSGSPEACSKYFRFDPRKEVRPGAQVSHCVCNLWRQLVLVALPEVFPMTGGSSVIWMFLLSVSFQF